MALTLTNTTLTSPIDKTEIETDLSEIQAKFNGGITNDDVSSSASLALSKLATIYEYINVHLKVVTADTGGWVTTVRTEQAITPMPNDSKGNWTVVSGSWSCSNTGAGTGAFDLVYGTASSGSWSTSTTLANSVTISNGAGANDFNSAEFSVSGTIAQADARAFALLVDTAESGTIDRVGDYLTVSLLLKRAVQST